MSPGTDNPLVEANTSEEHYYAEQRPDVAVPGTDVSVSVPGLQNMSPPSESGGTGVMSGITAFEAGWAIAEGIESGQWMVAASGLVAAGLDVAGAALDPIAYFSGQIISWMLEHIEPARQALHDLTGNPGVIDAYAKSWTNIEKEMTALGEDLKTAAVQETDGWQGKAALAYRQRAEDIAGLYGGTAGLAHGISALTSSMGEVVNGIRIAVRDILSAIAGSLVSWTIELTCSVGLAAPVVIAQATSAIARVSSKVARLVGTALKVVDEAGTVLVALRDLFDGFIRALNDMEKGIQTA